MGDHVLSTLADVDAPDGVRDGVQQAGAEAEKFRDCGDWSARREHAANLDVRVA
jgi:hypothetical protein